MGGIDRRHDAGAALVLALLTLLAFLPLLRAGFISLDDPAFVVRNPSVHQGLSPAGIRWALTSTENANWYPLTRLTQLLDFQLFGLDARGHHLTNLLLHLASSALLLLLLLRWTGRRGGSFLAAALFALHPLHVESVAWVTERSDVLAGLLWTLTLAVYGRYVRRPAPGSYLLVLLVVALGLASKATLVSLPLVLLALDFWPLGRFGGRRPTAGLLLEKAPLLALAGAASLMTYRSQALGGAVSLEAPFSIGQTLAITLPQVPLSYLTYLRKAIWPANLAVFYPHPAHGTQPVLVAGAVLALAAITLVALLARRRRPWLAAGWAWYLVALLPMSGIVQVGSQAIADRYTYLPLTGIFVAAVWSAAEGSRRLRVAAPVRRALAGALVALLALASFRQSLHWRDDFTLFSHALEATGPNGVAHAILGQLLLDRGDAAGAAEHFRESLALRPRHPESLFGMGVALAALGRSEEAIGSFQRLAEVQPANLSAHFNLGTLLLARGRHPEAVAAFRSTLALDPDNVAALEQLARALEAAGRPAESAVLAARARALRGGALPGGR